jgi:hypothetical protein
VAEPARCAGTSRNKSDKQVTLSSTSSQLKHRLNDKKGTCKAVSKLALSRLTGINVFSTAFSALTRNDAAVNRVTSRILFIWIQLPDHWHDDAGMAVLGIAKYQGKLFLSAPLIP